MSVIIPAHNEAECICGTIDSLLREEYPNLEIIVVDDGSTDGTEKLLVDRYSLRKEIISSAQELDTAPILRCYYKRFYDKRLVLISKENGGKADALNCGLNICRHPLCVMLDADTKVEHDSIRIMASRFLMDSRTIVCAGVVGSEELKNYPKLNIFRKMLVWFQRLEYYRTFYMQRILFGRLNANIIVSGAFAMFDTDLVKKAGGYLTNTIGEDMELTMRLHALCASQHRDYRIDYAPEAKCVTQLPFTFHDYCRQRRRWQIGMLQSMGAHSYMLGNLHYSWAGIIAGTFFVLYELLAPYLEVLGVATLIAANYLEILNLGFTVSAMIAYSAVIVLMQMTLVNVIDGYGVEQINWGQRCVLLFISTIEIVFFHPLNVIIKIAASITSYRYKKTWQDIRRIRVKQ